MLIEHMGNGFSYESFPGSIGVSKQTIKKKKKSNSEFLDAKEVGIEKSRIFWEKLGIDHIVNESESSKELGSSSKSLNASVWIFNMKNRFQWRDKQPDETDVVVNNNNITTMSDAELDAKLAKLEGKK